MKVTLFALFLPAFFACLTCEGQELPGVRSVDLSAASATFKAKKLTLDNMRITSDTTSANDYVRGTFKFQLSTQSFVPKSFQVFQNVGVFYNGTLNDQYFVNNATTPLVFTDSSGGVYYEYTRYTLNPNGTPYSINLSVGNVLSFNINSNTVDCRVDLRAPDGSTIYSDLVGANSSIISGTIAILQTGTYAMTITPLKGSSLSLNLAFGNANRQPLVTVQSGSDIQTNLRDGLRDYYKYKIHLNSGDRLSISAPSSSDTHLVLLNSQGVKLTDNTGLGILYIASASGDYFLFVDDRRAFGTDYYGSVTVESGRPDMTTLPETLHVGSPRTAGRP